MKAKRHQLAWTKVEVYRLFKVKDAALALKQSPDAVVAQLGSQIYDQAYAMVAPYCEEQNEASRRQAERPKRKKR